VVAIGLSFGGKDKEEGIPLSASANNKKTTSNQTVVINIQGEMKNHVMNVSRYVSICCPSTF
jgi:hypothetical protein